MIKKVIKGTKQLMTENIGKVKALLPFELKPILKSFSQ